MPGELVESLFKLYNKHVKPHFYGRAKAFKPLNMLYILIFTKAHYRDGLEILGSTNLNCQNTMLKMARLSGLKIDSIKLKAKYLKKYKNHLKFEGPEVNLTNKFKVDDKTIKELICKNAKTDYELAFDTEFKDTDDFKNTLCITTAGGKYADDDKNIIQKYYDREDFTKNLNPVYDYLESEGFEFERINIKNGIAYEELGESLDLIEKEIMELYYKYRHILDGVRKLKNDEVLLKKEYNKLSREICKKYKIKSFSIELLDKGEGIIRIPRLKLQFEELASIELIAHFNEVDFFRFFGSNYKGFILRGELDKFRGMVGSNLYMIVKHEGVFKRININLRDTMYIIGSISLKNLASMVTNDEKIDMEENPEIKKEFVDNGLKPIENMDLVREKCFEAFKEYALHDSLITLKAKRGLEILVHKVQGECGIDEENRGMAFSAGTQSAKVIKEISKVILGKIGFEDDKVLTIFAKKQKAKYNRIKIEIETFKSKFNNDKTIKTEEAFFNYIETIIKRSFSGYC
jgi:hypothetical protein